MLRFLVLGVAVVALASPGHGAEFIRRFMDFMGSDDEVSRAMRDVSENVRDTNDMYERAMEEDTMESVRELHRRLASLGTAEDDLVEEVREQSRSLADYTKRALEGFEDVFEGLEERDEEDPIQKTVRSIMEYADQYKREAEDDFEEFEERDEEDPIQKTVRSIMEYADQYKREAEDDFEEFEERDEEDPIQKTVRSIMEFAYGDEEKREAEEADEEVKRSLMGLHENINDYMKRDTEEEFMVPAAFARRNLDDAEHERIARAIESFYEAFEDE